MREWRFHFIILNVGTEGRWVSSFTPQPLYPYTVPVGHEAGWATAVLGTVKWRIIFCPWQESNPSECYEYLKLEEVAFNIYFIYYFLLLAIRIT
jgi:hypothetical protein